MVATVTILLEIPRYVRPEKPTCKQTADWLVFRIWNAIKAIFGQSVWQKSEKVLRAHLKSTGVIDAVIYKPAASAMLRDMIGKTQEETRLKVKSQLDVQKIL